MCWMERCWKGLEYLVMREVLTVVRLVVVVMPFAAVESWPL